MNFDDIVSVRYFDVDTSILAEDYTPPVFAPISAAELYNLFDNVNVLWHKISINVMTLTYDHHALDRINERKITLNELRNVFREAYRLYGKEIQQMGVEKPGFNGVLRDQRTKVNIPFELHWNSNLGMIDLRVKTVMRKDNFGSINSPFFRI